MNNHSRSIWTSALMVGGIAALSYSAFRYLYRLSSDSGSGFFHWTGPSTRQLKVGTSSVDLPIRYYRDDCFMGIFSANFEAIVEALPSRDLHPIRLPNGRAAFVVLAQNYLESSIGPYGEIALAIPCTYQRPSPVFMPLLLEERFPNWGAFVLHLPVTAWNSAEAGRAIWGYPKFVSDMDFLRRPEYQSVRLSEGGHHLLTLTVQQKGVIMRDNREIVSFTVRDRELLRTALPCRAIYHLGLTPGLASLDLGDHPIADQLRHFDLATASTFSKNYLQRVSILPAGEVLGEIERPYEGYVGLPLDFGRLTTNYDDDQESIDVYHRLRRVA